MHAPDRSCASHDESGSLVTAAGSDIKSSSQLLPPPASAALKEQSTRPKWGLTVSWSHFSPTRTAAKLRPARIPGRMWPSQLSRYADISSCFATYDSDGDSSAAFDWAMQFPLLTTCAEPVGTSVSPTTQWLNQVVSDEQIQICSQQEQGSAVASMQRAVASLRSETSVLPLHKLLRPIKVRSYKLALRLAFQIQQLKLV